MRLCDLEREGLINRTANPLEKLDIRYQLTKKEQDTMPILTAFIQQGMIHRANRVFEDKRARTLSQVFPEKQKPMLGQLIAYAAKENPRKLPTPSV